MANLIHFDDAVANFKKVAQGRWWFVNEDLCVSASEILHRLTEREKLTTALCEERTQLNLKIQELSENLKEAHRLRLEACADSAKAIKKNVDLEQQIRKNNTIQQRLDVAEKALASFATQRGKCANKLYDIIEELRRELVELYENNPPQQPVAE